MFEGLRLAVIAAVMLLVPFAASAQETIQYNVGGYIIECPNPGYSGIHPEIPSCTNNLLVQSIDQRMHRLVVELQREVSARVTSMSADDKARIDAQFAWLLNHINEGTADMMDFHYMTTFDLVPYELHQPAVENESVNVAVTYLLGANANMRISQSTRINDSLLQQNKKDLVDAINKAKRMLDKEYLEFNPLDMPQSSPGASVATPTTAN